MGFNLVLMGAPGSGKGTQAQLIGTRFNFVHISTGDLVRAEIAKGSDMGREIQDIVAGGAFPADDLILDLFKTAVSASAPGFIFDGMPRTLPQLTAVDELLANKGEAIHAVLELATPDDVLSRRLTGRFTCAGCGVIYNRYFYPLKDAVHCDHCGTDRFIHRNDDQADTVLRRLATYHRETEPLLDIYRARGLVCSVDATKPSSDVLGEISQIIERLMN